LRQSHLIPTQQRQRQAPATPAAIHIILQEKSNTANKQNKNKQQQQETENQIPECTNLTNMLYDSEWGDKLTQKRDGHIRILLQNISSIDLTPSGSIKLAALQ